NYLDIAFAFCAEEEAREATRAWTERIAWVRAPSFELPEGEPVPLISSPSVLQVDRIATEALKRDNRRFRIVFSAVDFAARFAAAAAGLGYMPLTRRLLPPHLAFEERALPPLGTLSAGIFVRDEFNLKGMQSLVDTLEAIGHTGGRAM